MVLDGDSGHRSADRGPMLRTCFWFGLTRGSRNLLFALPSGQHGRALRELLFESVTLGVFAGVAGLAHRRAALKLLWVSRLVHLPRANDIHIDAWVLLFAVVTSITVSVLFGLIPVLRYARPQIAR